MRGAAALKETGGGAGEQAVPERFSLAWRYPPDAASRAALRARLIEARLALPAADRMRAEEAIAVRLQQAVEQLTGASGAVVVPTVAVYRPVRGEPDPSASIAAWRGQGWRLALPRVVARDAPLEFGAWPQDGALVPGRFGIEQPEPFVVVCPDVIVAPCVGFDARGWRLGYGGGFYDRTLAMLGDVPALGVAFDQARVEGFEPQLHDRRLRVIVTPSASWWAGG